jgi:hypothetical protein
MKMTTMMMDFWIRGGAFGEFTGWEKVQTTSPMRAESLARNKALDFYDEQACSEGIDTIEDIMYKYPNQTYEEAFEIYSDYREDEIFFSYMDSDPEVEHI